MLFIGTNMNPLMSIYIYFVNIYNSTHVKNKILFSGSSKFCLKYIKFSLYLMTVSEYAFTVFSNIYYRGSALLKVYCLSKVVTCIIS